MLFYVPYYLLAIPAFLRGPLCWWLHCSSVRLTPHKLISYPTGQNWIRYPTIIYSSVVTSPPHLIIISLLLIIFTPPPQMLSGLGTILCEELWGPYATPSRLVSKVLVPHDPSLICLILSLQCQQEVIGANSPFVIFPRVLLWRMFPEKPFSKSKSD